MTRRAEDTTGREKRRDVEEDQGGTGTTALVLQA
jgi:hypothetical protein